MPVRAGVIVTGTEVLGGKVTDRNGPWISERLAENGVEIAHILCVGDRPDDVLSALRFMESEGMDIVVTSGGLGPTADDLTAEAVAKFAGVEMELDESMEEKIAAIIRKFARRFRFDPDALREANRKQAMVPVGSTTIDPEGTAPGLIVEAAGMKIVVLPGPPRELQPMWHTATDINPLKAELASAGEFHNFTLRLFGMPESELAASLREIEEDTDLSPLEITTCLRGGELEVDVRHRDGAEAAARAVRDGLAQRHSRFMFSLDGSTIDEQVAELLKGHTLAVAESCSAGKLAARLTKLPGASAYFKGGVVAYSDEIKHQALGVPEEMITEHGAVSPEVAEAMADGILERFDTELACAITGIAGPDGGTEEKPVGYVCFCVKSSDGNSLARQPVIPGNREDIRERSALVALHMLRVLLKKEDPPI